VTSDTENGMRRRTMVQAAWGAPVVLSAVAAPLASASPTEPGVGGQYPLTITGVSTSNVAEYYNGFSWGEGYRSGRADGQYFPGDTLRMDVTVANPSRTTVIPAGAALITVIAPQAVLGRPRNYRLDPRERLEFILTFPNSQTTQVFLKDAIAPGGTATAHLYFNRPLTSAGYAAADGSADLPILIVAGQGNDLDNASTTLSYATPAATLTVVDSVPEQAAVGETFLWSTTISNVGSTALPAGWAAQFRLGYNEVFWAAAELVQDSFSSGGFQIDATPVLAQPSRWDPVWTLTLQSPLAPGGVAVVEVPVRALAGPAWINGGTYDVDDSVLVDILGRDDPYNGAEVNPEVAIRL
jgi:hypothetical protein